MYQVWLKLEESFKGWAGSTAEKFHTIDNKVLLFSLHRYLASQKLNVYGVATDPSFHPRTDRRWLASQEDQPFLVDCIVDSCIGLQHPAAYVAYDKENQVQSSTDIYWNQNSREVTHSFLKDFSPILNHCPCTACWTKMSGVAHCWFVHTLLGLELSLVGTERRTSDLQEKEMELEYVLAVSL